MSAPSLENTPQKRVYGCTPISDGPGKICKKKTHGIIRRFPAEKSAPKKGYTDVYLFLTALFDGPFLGPLNPYNTRVYKK